MEAYKVQKRLGVGTYGSAYLVSLTQDPSQLFCLKKVRLDEDADDERQAAELEVTILTKLHHPLVLRYVDHFLYKGHLCIVTEYCDAGDMYTYLRARKTAMPEAQVLDWLVQVLLAIQHVHSKNILHRDLKTQNIFLTKDNTVRLGDFGISRPLSSATDLARTLIGTPYYLSPEVMSSQPYDFKSDMWSLGCCLYEMLSLRHAFDASDMPSLVMKIMRGEHLPIPTQFSPELRDLTKQLLSRLPSKRPSTDAVLKLPWLKEYVLRTRDKVARMEMVNKAFVLAHSRRHSIGNGPDPDLDRELEAAKARLARIQAERDSVAARLSTGACGSPGSGNNLDCFTPRPPLAPATATFLPALSDKKSYLTPGSNRSTPGIADARLDGFHSVPMPGEGQQRVSQSGSMDGSPYGAGSPSQHLDRKARIEARRQEENKQREAELLGARRAYFEERKHAEARKQQMLHGQTPHSSQSVPSGVRGSMVMGSGDLFARSSQGRVAMPHRWSCGGGAEQEFEDELCNAPQSTANRALLQSFEGLGCNPQAIGATARALGLRDLAIEALGLPLFDLVYGVMRQRNGQADDGAVRQELLVRMGPNRVQYLQLLEALLFYEDQAAGVVPDWA